jgi:RND family efflux transporter MFP subunit
VLRIQRMIREGKFQSARMTPERIVGAALALSNLRGGNFMPLASQFGLPRVPVFLGLETEPGQFPHEGFIDFVNNVVTPSTGTLSVRGLFPNGDRALTPGLFVRVRIPLGAPHPVLLVSDLALGMDQGQRFVYVVNAKNEVVFRPVTVGRLQGRLRVIEAGIGPNDRIIVNGLVRVRPGITVEPRMTPMPFAPEAAENGKAEDGRRKTEK